MSPPQPKEATGVIADLFAQSVGFYSGWGFTRPVTGISPLLLMPGGNVDWKGASVRVESALSDTVAVPPDPLEGLPKGIYTLSPELYGGVAVSQCCSGWGGIPGVVDDDAQRFVLLRCLTGKEREAGELKNAAYLQYRLWRRIGNSLPERLFDLRKAWPMFEDVHQEITNRLTGG
jgi:hypothetical protein